MVVDMAVTALCEVLPTMTLLPHHADDLSMQQLNLGHFFRVCAK